MSTALTPVEFDTSDRPSMGDPIVVDGLVREMLDETRKILFAAEPGSNPQVEIKKISAKWTERLWAGNEEFVQTMTPEAQMVWLQNHELGHEEEDEKQVVACLVNVTLDRFVTAMVKHAEGQIDDEGLQFRLDTAIEDCSTLLLGIENTVE